MWGQDPPESCDAGNHPEAPARATDATALDAAAVRGRQCCQIATSAEGGAAGRGLLYRGVQRGQPAGGGDLLAARGADPQVPDPGGHDHHLRRLREPGLVRQLSGPAHPPGRARTVRRADARGPQLFSPMR
uniref:(northern house mosquito) hypothetical protein n=1 Tax=Culex pipiens TaxID=7175 RepID=A0A8D8BRZ0_CULPI